MSEPTRKSKQPPEQAIVSLMRASVNVEIMSYTDDGDNFVVFARGRPFGRKAVKDSMAVGMGSTVVDALVFLAKSVDEAIWYKLDWAFRPGEWYTSKELPLSGADPEHPKLPTAH